MPLEVLRISPAIMITCVTKCAGSETECLQSSTWRELSVIEFVLQSFASVPEGSHVKWFTDSQVADKITEVGSMKLDLHMMARNIFSIYAVRNSLRSGMDTSFRESGS